MTKQRTQTLNSRLKIALLIVSVLFLSDLSSKAQVDSTNIYNIQKIGNFVPQVNNTISLSVSGVSIHEFLRNVAKTSNINIDIDPSINDLISNNFKDVKIIDLLIFLSAQYNLEISNTGSIIKIRRNKYIPVIEKRTQFNPDQGTVSFDYKNEEIGIVIKDIIQESKKNVIISPGNESSRISIFIKELPFDNALEKLSFANNLVLRKTEDGVYILERNQEYNETSKINPRKKNRSSSSAISVDSISITEFNTPIKDLIQKVSDQLQIDYFFISPIEGTVNVSVQGLTYDQFLNFITRGTNIIYRKQGNIYFIGDKKTFELKESRLIQLKHRSVDKLIELISAEFSKELDIKEYANLNSLLVVGYSTRISEFEQFINKIDKPIPVVLIEILIVDINKSTIITTALEAGLGEEPATTKGQAFAGFDMSLNAQSINNLINSFNGFGSINIGKVTPNFYANIKALEEQGCISIRSTPKLSTLNGHEASLSIGNTEYYLEEQSNFYGSLSAQLTTIQTYKPVNAELLVKIKPFVSGDDQITLDIEVSQSDFTERISKYAPPGSVKRNFKSLIRVKNSEMILLGGLEEKRKREYSSGVPLLSRIPILKWLFSSRNRTSETSKLNIFIKPTIIN